MYHWGFKWTQIYLTVLLAGKFALQKPFIQNDIQLSRNISQCEDHMLTRILNTIVPFLTHLITSIHSHTPRPLPPHPANRQTYLPYGTQI